MKNFYSAVVSVLMTLLCLCPAYTEMCEFESCLYIYNNLMGLLPDSSTELITLCELQQDLKDCNKKLARQCRGDLNYHFFEKLVRDLSAKIKNCSSVVPGSRPVNSNDNKGALPNTPSKSGTSLSSSSSSSGGGGGRGVFRKFPDKCTPKVPADSSFVGCALYGLTNLKSYSQSLNNTDVNYCSLSGAWSLIDTPEFAVQITNKGGLRPLPKDITTTTLVTVIIKSNQCSERKTYQATFDEVPGMFSDGSTTANSVYIETMKESEHVKIHFPYLLATIDIVKVISDRLPIPSLSVTIRMPQHHVSNLLNDPSRLRGLSLCFYGCPNSAIMKGRSLEPRKSICENYDSSSSSTVSEFPSENTDGNDAINSAICASYKSVQNLLLESTVVDKKLDFPGEENFGISSENPPVERFSVENSALTSHGYQLFKNGYPSLSLFASFLIYFVVR